MFVLVKKSEIIVFLAKYGIDFLTLSEFDQSVIILLSNIFFLLFWIFVISFVYKLFCRITRWL